MGIKGLNDKYFTREVDWENLIYVTDRWDSIKNCEKTRRLWSTGVKEERY